MRIGVGDEGLDLLRRRRQADEIEIEPAAQRARIRLGRQREMLLRQLRADEGVDGIARFGGGRLPDCGERLQRPPIERIAFRRARALRPDRALVDPRAQQADLLRRQRIALGRHLHVGIEPRDEMDQRALRAFAGHDVRRMLVAAGHAPRLSDPPASRPSASPVRGISGSAIP